MRGRAKRGLSFPGSSHCNFCEEAPIFVEFCHEDQLAVQKNTEALLNAILATKNNRQIKILKFLLARPGRRASEEAVGAKAPHPPQLREQLRIFAGLYSGNRGVVFNIVKAFGQCRRSHFWKRHERCVDTTNGYTGTVDGCNQWTG